MTFADLDHNDELLAARKKEKLEWVTPKISLMGAEETSGTKNRTACREGFASDGYQNCVNHTAFGPS
jgi:hypothetical protein